MSLRGISRVQPNKYSTIPFMKILPVHIRTPEAKFRKVMFKISVAVLNDGLRDNLFQCFSVLKRSKSNLPSWGLGI